MLDHDSVHDMPLRGRTLLIAFVLLLSSLMAISTVGSADSRAGFGPSDDLNTTVTFNAAGTDATTTVSLNAYANVTSFSFNLTGEPVSGDSAYNVSVWIGDATGDPEFNHAGSLGKMEQFDGYDSTTVLFDTPQKYNDDVKFSLPVGTQVSAASFDIEGLGSNFNGSLFVNIDYIECVAIDSSNGDVWYGTSGGAVRRETDGSRTVYTVSSGLPHPVVSDIAIDTTKVYLATQGGVAIFDKTLEEIEATTWTTQLRDLDAVAVAVDATYVYVGSFESVDRYNKGTTFFDARWNLTNGDFTAAGTITDIYSDTGGLYISHAGGGVSYTATPASPTWSTITTPDLVHHTVNCVSGDANFIYYGTTFGGTVYNKTSTAYTKLTNASNDLVKNDIQAVASDASNIYFMTDSGVSMFAKNNLTEEGMRLTASDLGINNIQAAAASTMVYFGTYGNGIVPYNPGTGVASEAWLTGNGPLQNIINGVEVFNSQTGGVSSAIYFATDAGISIYNKQISLFDDPLTFADGLPGGYGISCTYVDAPNNIMYIGTKGAGVYRYDIENDQFLTAWTSSVASIPLGSNLINFIEEDSGKLYIGTTGGLDIYNIGAQTWDHWTTADGLANNYCKSFYASTTKLFIGSTFGLTVYDKGGSTFDVWDSADGLPAEDINSVIVDGTTVYIATYEGVAHSTLTGTIGTIWNVSNGDLPSNTVPTLYSDSTHIYVCTSLGVERWNKTAAGWEALKWNTTNKRLPSNFVKSIALDSPILYLGTQGGIARYNMSSGLFFPLSSAVNTNPRDPMLDVDGDMAAEWSHTDFLDSKVASGDLTTAFNTYLAGASADHYDMYGNGFVNVSMNFSVDLTSVGALKLDNLNLEYATTLNTGNMADAVNTYIAAHRGEADAAGNVTIPIVIGSSGAGKVKLSDLEVSHTFLARPPVAVINKPMDGTQYSVSDMIEFDALNSTDPDMDIASFTWTSSISGPIFPAEGNGSAFSIPASDIGIGNHTITLTVTDEKLNSNQTSVEIEVIEGEVVIPGAPSAIIVTPGPVSYHLAGEIITFDGSGSFDPDNDTITYEWISSKDGVLGTTPVVNTSLSWGTHQVTLYVEDPGGLNDTASVMVVVNTSVIDTFTADIVTEAAKTVTVTIRVLHQYPGYTMTINKASTPASVPAGLADIGFFFNVTTDIPDYAWAAVTLDYSDAVDKVTGTIPGISALDSLVVYSFNGGYTMVPIVHDITGREIHYNVTTGLEVYGVYGNKSTGGGGGGDGGSGGNVTVPPEVTSVEPADGSTGVLVSSAITATFDQQLLEDYIPSNFIVKVQRTGAIVEGSFEYSPTANSFTVRFVPNSELDYEETYIVTISPNVRNVAGDRLDSDGDGVGGEAEDEYSWTFTTEDIPAGGDGGDGDGAAGFFDGPGVFVIFAVILLLALVLGGLAAFMFFKDKKKETEYDDAMEEAKDKQSVTCNSCGTENAAGADVCANCGATIGEFKEAPEPEKPEGEVEEGAVEEEVERVLIAPIICPTCAAEVGAGLAACPACGEDDFSEVEGVEWSVDEEAPQTDVVCPSCGAVVEAGQTTCEACGEDDLSAAENAPAPTEDELPPPDAEGLPPPDTT